MFPEFTSVKNTRPTKQIPRNSSWRIERIICNLEVELASAENLYSRTQLHKMTPNLRLTIFQTARRHVKLLIVFSLFLLPESCSCLAIQEKPKHVKVPTQNSRFSEAGEHHERKHSTRRFKFLELPVSAGSKYALTSSKAQKSTSEALILEILHWTKKRSRINSDSHKLSRIRTEARILSTNRNRVVPRYSLRSSFKEILKSEETSRLGHSFKTRIRHSTICPKSESLSCYLKITVSTEDSRVGPSMFRKILGKTVARLKREFKSFFVTAKVTIERSSSRIVRDTINTSSRQTVKNTYNIRFFVPWNIDWVWVY